MADFLNDLNEVQRKAACDIEGPSLIIAGAGSGKTRVLTYRIAYLLDQGYPSHSILALTFTNKAAREMKERISKLVGEDQARTLWMGTFHSIFARILRYEAEKTGFSKNFSIYDTADSRNLIKSIVKEMQLEPETYKAALIHSRISKAKNNLISPAVYENDPDIQRNDYLAKIPQTATIYQQYFLRCKRADAMDFDDLLLYTNILLRDHQQVLDKYQHIFRFILVDEYQDTNKAQYLIIKKLASLHRNICVVGDDAQSIYGFRGARIENILNFKSDYPDYRLYKLEQNYRSTQLIVNAANSLINKNKNQIAKKSFSLNDQGSLIKVLAGNTDHEEGFLVCSHLYEKLLTDKADYKDFAILYRTNAQSRIFEEALRKKNLPYKIYGGVSFYQRKEIKDMLAYFRLVINYKDDEAFRRVINYPARGIGDTSLEKLEFAALANKQSLYETALNGTQTGISAGINSKILAFIKMIEIFRKQLHKLDAYELANRIAAASGIVDELKKERSIEAISRSENIDELINSIMEFVEKTEKPEDATLDRYIQEIALLTDQDNEKPEDFNKITLMTIHSAKGLEFKYVYIAGLEENLFPSSFSLENAEDIEEERRLFYVAITRAEKLVTLSYASTRFRWGSIERSIPSRFINEIDAACMDRTREKRSHAAEPEWDIPPSGKTYEGYSRLSKQQKTVVNHAKSSASEISFTPDDPEKIKTGMMVVHERFGQGKVLLVEGALPNTKATVFFQNTGQKTLLLKFARLKILN